MTPRKMLALALSVGAASCTRGPATVTYIHDPQTDLCYVRTLPRSNWAYSLRRRAAPLGALHARRPPSRRRVVSRVHSGDAVNDGNLTCGCASAVPCTRHNVLALNDKITIPAGRRVKHTHVFELLPDRFRVEWQAKTKNITTRSLLYTWEGTRWMRGHVDPHTDAARALIAAHALAGPIDWRVIEPRGGWRLGL